MKIALFTGNYHHIRDGVSITLNRWVKYAMDHGVNIQIFAPTIAEPQVEHQGTMIPVPSAPAPGRPEYRISLFLPAKEREQLESFDPDIVHIATPDVLGFTALHWAKKHQKKVVATFHTNFVSYLKYYGLGAAESVGWRLLVWFYNQCDRTFAPTESMREELMQRGVSSPLSIWARGVDTQRFNPARRSEQWRRNHGISPNDIVISFISRLVWEKNIKLYADVIRQLSASHPNVKALVAGDGPAGEDLRKMLPNAIFTGFLQGDQLADAYANSDLFLFPSDTETFGNVTLEAMASGVPCIVADAPGSGSLVKDGENGYLLRVSDSDRFLKRAEELLLNKVLRESMGARSVELAQEYRLSRIQQGFLEELSDMLQYEMLQN